MTITAQEVTTSLTTTHRQRSGQLGWWRRPGLSLTGLLFPALLLGLWQLGTSTGSLEPIIFPAPSAVAQTLVNLLFHGTLVSDFWDSLQRILIGALLGISAGILIGGVAGSVRQAERLLDPTIQGIRAVPAVAWIPFLILWLGIGDQPKIVLIGIATFFPMYINTFAGVRSTDQKLIELARAYRLSHALVLRRIIFPSALPQVFVGLRLAATIMWVAAVFTEILAGNTGLGVLLNDGRSLGRPDQTVAVMLVLALAGKTTDGLVRAVERQATRWRATFEGA